MLDQDQVAAYQRDGFVVVPGLVEADDRRRLRPDLPLRRLGSVA